MNQVIAKIRTKQSKKYFKILSDVRLFETLQVSGKERVSYCSDYNLDEDEWFQIDAFSSQDYCPALLKKDFDSKEYDDLPKEQFPKIEFLCAVQDGNFYFQRVTPSLLLERKWIVFGEVVKLQQADSRLVVKDEPDAVYLADEDVLLFRNMQAISSIFRGVDVLYKEATKEEVEKFLAQEFVSTEKGFDESKVSKPNRRRVALAVDTLKALPAEQRSEIVDYIKEYCDEKLIFDEKEGKVKVSSDDDLKLLVYGIEQRFYTTPFGKEKRLANAVKKM